MEASVSVKTTDAAHDPIIAPAAASGTFWAQRDSKSLIYLQTLPYILTPQSSCTPVPLPGPLDLGKTLREQRRNGFADRE